MFTERDQHSSSFKLGEGSIGQVASEKKPILLKSIVKEDQLILTGTIAASPLETYTFPLMINEDLIGVAELAMTTSLTPLHLEYLTRASGIIASTLNVVLQKERVQKLLIASEEATKQAEGNSRKLEEFNTQLEEQQQQLQQQAEELQQSNAQMEEQQQQLQQQAEELQQSNAQMEEQQQQLLQQNEELRQAKA